MKFFVTGATGFLGSRLCRLLLEAGHEVTALRREKSRTEHLDGLDLRFVTIDLHDTAGLTRALSGHDGLFHVAGKVSFYRKDREELYRTNVEGARSIVSAARDAGVPKVVQTSSVSAIGFRRDGVPADEETPFNWSRDFHYPWSKKLGEEAAFALATPDFHVVCVNPGVIYGPGDIHWNGGVLFKALARGRLRAIPNRGGFSVCDVDDVARGHLLAFEKGVSGRRYILAGPNLPYREVARIAAEAVGVDPPSREVPTPVVRVFQHLIDMAERLGKRPPIPALILKTSTMPLYYSSERAKRELGYETRSFEEMCRRAVAFYRERKML
ncbi:MAG: NAD-dependent epimerase/dehydratase family protein [Deltaproteobacteria bacterium]|nr:MAG: NAD-dependent epimerase/dehydratase family protein [Deltaproteobacteria bacterium]